LSPEFPSSVGVGQGSALSPILLALCLAPLLKEFECRVCVAVLISYVDNGTIIVQSDTWDKNLVKLKTAYKMVFELTQSMGLVLEHSKSEGFHFSQKHSDSNPDIDLGYAPYTGATPLHPGTIWQYLGFFFDCALTVCEHVKHYINKALTTMRAMLALGNSLCGLQLKHKQMLYCACVLPIAMYGSRLWLYKGAAMKGPLDSLRKMQRCACLWITGAFKTSPIRAAETLMGVPPIHHHVKKLVEQSHVCTCMLQGSHAFCRLVDRDHKFSIKTLKGQIQGDLKSPVTEAWLNLDLSSLDLDPINRTNLACTPRIYTMGASSMTLCPLHPKQTRITRSSWPTGSTCFTAVLMWPPTPPSASALLQTRLPLPYPSSQSQLSTSGVRGTSTTTDLQLVLLCLTTPNCKQSQTASVKPTMLVWRMYDKYMSSPTPQMRSALQWTCLITWDNTCPYPFAKCWCLGSGTTQITVSISTTSQLVWSWRITSLHTSLPHQLTSRQEVHQSYLPTLLDAEQSHGCLRAGTHCSSPKSTLD
jgi:hypothetical protein